LLSTAHLVAPGIYHSHAATFEIGGFASGRHGAVGAGNGCEGVEFRDGTALGATIGGNSCEGVGSFLVERKNAGGQHLVEHAIGTGEQRSAVLALRQLLDSGQDLTIERSAGFLAHGTAVAGSALAPPALGAFGQYRMGRSVPVGLDFTEGQG
jgi:hypothetical protein